MAYSYYSPFTVDHTKVGATDSTNFPVGIIDNAGLARLKSTGNGGHVTSASGYDIRPFSDAALTSALTYELVFYDPTSGKIEMWVKIPTLSHTVDTVIYLGYGDSSITTDGSSTSTWDATFGGVWHYRNGSALTVTDSTANANNGTNNGATAAAGQIDGGAAAVAASSQYIDNGNSATLTPLLADSFQISCWLKSTSTAVSFPINRRGSGANGWELGANLASSGDIVFRVSSSGGGAASSNVATACNDGSWHYIVAQMNRAANQILMYKDGAAVGSPVAYLPAGNYTPVVNMDVFARAGANFYGATMDEIRWEVAARSADWITACYNNQNAPGTFYAVGVEVASSTGVIQLITLQSTIYRGGL